MLSKRGQGEGVVEEELVVVAGGPNALTTCWRIEATHCGWQLFTCWKLLALLCHKMQLKVSKRKHSILLIRLSKCLRLNVSELLQKRCSSGRQDAFQLGQAHAQGRALEKHLSLVKINVEDVT